MTYRLIWLIVTSCFLGPNSWLVSFEMFAMLDFRSPNIFSISLFLFCSCWIYFYFSLTTTCISWTSFLCWIFNSLYIFYVWVPWALWGVFFESSLTWDSNYLTFYSNLLFIYADPALLTSRTWIFFYNSSLICWFSFSVSALLTLAKASSFALFSIVEIKDCKSSWILWISGFFLAFVSIFRVISLFLRASLNVLFSKTPFKACKRWRKVSICSFKDYSFIAFVSSSNWINRSINGFSDKLRSLEIFSIYFLQFACLFLIFYKMLSIFAYRVFKLFSYSLRFLSSPACSFIFYFSFSNFVCSTCSSLRSLSSFFSKSFTYFESFLASISASWSASSLGLFWCPWLDALGLGGARPPRALLASIISLTISGLLILR